MREVTPDHLVQLNRVVNAARAFFGLKRWSFSQTVKLKVKSACKFISNFEQALLSEALRKGQDGIICGHVHQPDIRPVGCPEGIGIYANCGDWIERATALVEHDDGQLEVVDIERLLLDNGITTSALRSELVPLDADALAEVQP